MPANGTIGPLSTVVVDPAPMHPPTLASWWSLHAHALTLALQYNRTVEVFHPMSIPVLLAIAIIALYIINSIKILKEYERAVVFRLGRVRESSKGPGVILVFRPVDQIVRISLRQEAMEVPPQDVITRDNVTLKVNAVITLRVVDPTKAVIQVANYIYQTSQFAQTTLRSVLGEVDLDGLLAHREALNQRIQTIIDGHTAPFGVKVVSVEVKQVDMPESMLRAMAKQAEAEREARAKIIHAEGEFKAAAKLVEAAALMSAQPLALQLRYLQTLTEIGVEKNTTIVFPLPIELMNLLNKTISATPAPATVKNDV
jgi:regulator of protease activity HflC (stomatin/prohibitin superfamily)